MLRRFSINFAVLSILLDMLVVVGSMLLSAGIREWLNAYAFIKPITGPVSLPIQLYVLFPFTSVLVFTAFDLYNGKKYLRVVDEFGALTISWVILSVSLAGILYFSFRDVSRALYLVFIILVYLGMLSWRSLARLNFRLRNGHDEEVARRVLIIGAGPLGQRVRQEISRQSVEGLKVVGFLDDHEHSGDDTVNLMGGCEAVVKVVQDYRITDIVIALPYTAYPNLGRIVMALEKIPVRIWVALGFFDLALYRMGVGVANMAGIPMLDLRAPALNEFQLLTKRVFDLIFGSLALVLFAPLMVLASVLIWLEDRGPVIFKQKRAGENGRLFTVYKFRTMVPGAEELPSLVAGAVVSGHTIHKMKDDQRVTKIGKVLRRTSIDELPQLVNVLQGTMSLVGPRPELPQLVDGYQSWQRRRFSVPPGITGWWQVIGRSDRPMHLHTEDDLYYIQNYSIWLDLQILVRTIWIVMIGRGAY